MSRLTVKGNIVSQKDINKLMELSNENQFGTNDVYYKLKKYEDLEEQGLLLKLPCKIGDNVYKIPSKTNYNLNILDGYYENNRVYNQKVSRIILDDDYWYLECDKDREYGTGVICLDKFFGKTWFLSKEEAEQELKRLEGAE